MKINSQLGTKATNVLQVLTTPQREIENNDYAKFCWDNKNIIFQYARSRVSEDAHEYSLTTVPSRTRLYYNRLRLSNPAWITGSLKCFAIIARSTYVEQQGRRRKKLPWHQYVTACIFSGNDVVTRWFLGISIVGSTWIEPLQRRVLLSATRSIRGLWGERGKKSLTFFW